MNTVPNDPVMLLSFVNMKLRDFYPDPDEMCRSMGLERENLEQKLTSIGYEYDPETNQYV